MTLRHHMTLLIPATCLTIIVLLPCFGLFYGFLQFLGVNHFSSVVFSSICVLVIGNRLWRRVLRHDTVSGRYDTGVDVNNLNPLIENIEQCWEIVDLDDGGPGYAVKTASGKAFYLSGPELGAIDDNGESLPSSIKLSLHNEDHSIVLAKGFGRRVPVTKRVSALQLVVPVETSFMEADGLEAFLQVEE